MSVRLGGGSGGWGDTCGRWGSGVGGFDYGYSGQRAGVVRCRLEEGTARWSGLRGNALSEGFVRDVGRGDRVRVLVVFTGSEYRPFLKVSLCWTL